MLNHLVAEGSLVIAIIVIAVAVAIVWVSVCVIASAITAIKSTVIVVTAADRLNDNHFCLHCCWNCFY